MSRSGFTLIELLISISLFCFLIFLIVPHTTFLSSHMVRSELDRLFLTCHYLQHCAMMTNEVQVLNVDTGTHSYSYEDTNISLPRQVRIGTRHNVLGPPSNPQQRVVDPVTFKDHAIVFSPEGSIQAGSVYITNIEHTCQYALTVPVGGPMHIRTYVLQDKWKCMT